MDINFLPDEGKKNKLSEDKKDKEELKRETEWSKPERSSEEPKNKLSKGAKRGIKSYLPGLFSANFFKKKKGTEPTAVYPNNLAGKKKLKESRKEVLKFVKEQKKEVSYPPRPEPNKPPEAKTAPPTKKKMAWLKFKNLFNPLVGIIKKLGKKTRNQESQKTRNQESRRKEIGEDKQPPVKKEEIAPEFSQIKDKKEWKEEEILETNLIKDEITVFFNWQKNIAILLIFVVLSALAVGVVYGGLSWWGSQKEKESQYFAERFIETDKEISRVEEEVKEILIFKKKLSLANSLLGQHIYWTNFFKFLEENTLADVYYLGFSGDNKGKYNMSVNAKDFNVIQAQVKQMLSSEYVLGASVDQASIVAGEISFELKLLIDPAIFTTNATN